MSIDYQSVEESFKKFEFLFCSLISAPYFRNPIQKSPDGGIGRRARLKIWFSQESAGSIPVLGTLKAIL